MGFYTGTIQHGSNNQDTKRWQEFLRSQGYDLEADGIFGDITKKYTTDYQSKNGLAVDGIVGEKTWGKAGFSNANTPITAPQSTPAPSQPTMQSLPTAPTLSYTKWNDTTQGEDALDSKNDLWREINSYNPHTWANQDWYNQILTNIKDRPDFSYDFNQDALYQQYKDKYTKQAKMAMADTMGQAAAMTGGYGSSYASTVGNQAYQASLENLNDIIPELYQMAYDRYNQQGQDLYNQANFLMNDYNKSYGEWQDGYNMLVNKYGMASDDYYKGANLHASEQNNKNNVTQQNWQNKFNTVKESNNITQQNWQNEFDIWDANNNNAWKKASWDEDARRWVIENEREADKWDWQKKNSNVTSGGDDNNGGNNTDGDDKPIVSPGDSTSVKSFMNSLSPESAHDAIARQMYGTYNGYVATMLSKDKSLTADEKAWIMSYYGITETDLDYSENALKNGKRTEDSPKTTVKPYAERTWTEVDDGGINWFWGVDEDAVYKDNYGNEYTGEELVNLLVKEGMSEKKAKEYVKKLQ